MSEETDWYYSNEGEQVGPVNTEALQQLVADGVINEATSVWADGLEDWIPAGEVEGLLPETSASPMAAPATTTASAPAPLAGPSDAVSPLSEAESAPQMAPSPVIAEAVTPVTSAGPPAGVQAPESPEPHAGEYPVEEIKRASFGKILVFLFGGIAVAVVGALVANLMVANAEPRTPGAEPDELMVTSAVLVGLGAYVLGSILSTLGGVLAMIYLYRAWKILRWNQPRTTPGKAIGFLFIPVFNLYWIYVAYRGLAEDWNRTMASFPDLTLAPRLSSGLFLTYCICIWTGVGLVALPIVALMMYSQVCRGINFMATRAAMQSRPGGLQLY